jgi:hypothetical protein
MLLHYYTAAEVEAGLDYVRLIDALAESQPSALAAARTASPVLRGIAD